MLQLLFLWTLASWWHWDWFKWSSPFCSRFIFAYWDELKERGSATWEFLLLALPWPNPEMVTWGHQFCLPPESDSPKCMFGWDLGLKEDLYIGPFLPPLRGQAPIVPYVTADYPSTWMRSDAYGLTVGSWCFTERIE